jgi:predicted HAD superfamily hydrolase
LTQHNTNETALLPSPNDGKNFEVVSFDVFDTLVTRVCFKPTDLFLFIPQHLEQSAMNARLDALSFRHERVRAEQTARKIFDPQEVTLDQIYECFTESVPAALVNAAKQAEKDLEIQMATAIAENVSIFNAARDKGQEVLCISDMYLDTATVKQILEGCGIKLKKIFVSSDVGARKRTGSLFKYVALRISNRRWSLHIGDHPISDIKMAQKVGIPTKHYVEAVPLDAEMQVYGVLSHDPRLASIVSGSLRSTRLSKQITKNQTTRRKHFGETIAPIAATACACFVQWQCKQFLDSNIDHIFYLARDGHLPYRTYLTMRKIYPDLPPATYLKISRASIRLASLSLREDMNAPVFSSLLKLAPDELDLGAWLDLDGDERDTLRRFLGADTTKASAKVVLSKLEAAYSNVEHDVHRLINSALERQTLNFLNYLVSMGFFFKERIAIVDLGWNGSLQKDLSRFIGLQHSKSGRGTKQDLLGLYWGLRSRPLSLTSPAKSWLFDLELGIGRSASYPLQVIELIFGAPHSSTLAYRVSNDSSVIPVLSPSPEGTVDEVCLNDVEDLTTSILKNVATYLANEKDRFPLIGHTPAVRSLIARLLHTPKPDEARHFKDLVLRADPNDQETSLLPSNISDLKAVLIGLNLAKLPSPSYWSAGRISLLNTFPLNVFRAINTLKWKFRNRA